ncbi:hypothetical protein [Fusarium redolens polymycovirus 1]|uniref:Uncharacterized protein n=1 Tax=Fusarium redolens polymycovirus 1 TaxID=2546034 RepID=A0A513ZVF4_9VIRU|nr:hypothetical protein KM555_s6gp1 [Fusarium redolens polymycovirus 1]QDH44661.1 hypothetical protein [Fusarium redolens polymycovirus 1]
MAANARSAMHISCAKRQMMSLSPLSVDESGVLQLHHDEEGHVDVVSGELSVPFRFARSTASGDPVAGLAWFSDVVVVLREQDSVAGGLVFRDNVPKPVRVYFPHIRQGVDFSVVWDNANQPNQNPRYCDSKGLCSSPDPYRVIAVSGALQCFG